MVVGWRGGLEYFPKWAAGSANLLSDLLREGGWNLHQRRACPCLLLRLSVLGDGVGYWTQSRDRDSDLLW